MKRPPTLADLATAEDGSQTFFHFEGTINAFNFGEGATALFGLSGFNVRRRFEHQGSTFMLSRELAFYLDLETGAILRSWQNAFTGKTVTVVPIQNDPVNLNLSKGNEVVSLGDYWSYRQEVYPCYPLPGQSTLYTSAEHFHFLLSKRDWQQGKSDRVVCSWSRSGPWLNWMEMEEKPGFLQYHATGRRIQSEEQLPAWLLREAAENYPLFLTAPKELTRNKNATSFNQIV
ncbi:MAG: DUF1838 family protein [Candidatus Obscuribacter sp.]|nr:DUF1838 family protein [Candidatus Obscuribacter sp.]